MPNIYVAWGTAIGRTDTFVLQIERYKLRNYAIQRYADKAQISINLLKPTGYVMHHQFNIQQLHALSTLYLCVLYLS